MPELFEIHSSAGNYAVRSEPDVLARCRDELVSGVVLADAHFSARLAAQGIAAIALESTEATKSLDRISDLVIAVRERGARRDSHLWAIGGGTIQDVAGFVASIYMRGMRWSYLPTTLLGMVDSCIGGKSSINVGICKNLVGTFHPPAQIIIDATLTASLSVEQRVAGLAEAAKICFCRGPDTFARYLAHDPHVLMSPQQLEPLIVLSLGAKKWFVEVDELDRAERLLLNLGHTFGHALEAASGYALSHGVGVALGMLCALHASRSLLGQEPGGAVPALIAHVHALLARLPDLPRRLATVQVPVALEKLKADKKHNAAGYRLVTYDAAGHAVLARIPRSAASEQLLSAALQTTLESLHE